MGYYVKALQFLMGICGIIVVIKDSIFDKGLTWLLSLFHCGFLVDVIQSYNWIIIPGIIIALLYLKTKNKWVLGITFVVLMASMKFALVH